MLCHCRLIRQNGKEAKENKQMLTLVYIKKVKE